MESGRLEGEIREKEIGIHEVQPLNYWVLAAELHWESVETLPNF